MADRRHSAAEGHEPTLAVEDAETLAHDGSQPPGDLPPGAELAPGARLGRYKLSARIGAGAMGVVWAARDPKLDRAVAIKVVHPALARTPDAAARLLREARAMAKVSHRAVVAVHDAGEASGQLYLAMELVEGTTLGRMLRERDDAARRDWRRWLALLVEAGGGLVAAHAAGIVHRDFKPDNVLVARDGRVCVGDFGVAELTTASRSAAPAADAGPSASTSMNLVDLTTTGALVGTPAYMSPEQLRGNDADARSDQFAFCVALHEAVYGVRPFALPARPDPGAVAALIETIEQGRLEPVPRDRRVPPWIREAIVRGLAPAPADRWPDLATLLAALTRRRAGARTWGLAGGAVALAAAAGVAYVATRDDAAAPPPSRPRSGALDARPLYAMPMRPALALAPDGTRVAIASADRLVVRALDGDRVWQFDHKGERAIDRVEMPDATHVRVSLSGTTAPPELVVWNVDTNAIESRRTLPAGARWLGEVTGGSLISRHADDARSFELRVLDAAGERTIARGSGRLEVFSISPDRTRVAYVEPVQFAGQPIIVDVATARAIRSAPIVELTGLAWQDASTLWLTTGTTTEPALHDAVVEADAIATPRKRYGKPRGWFGQVVSASGRTLLVDSANSFRAKLVSPTGTVQDLDPELIGAALGWLDETRWLAWNRTTGDLAPDDDRPEQRVPAAIDGEPGNATLADEIAIVAMRKPGGREVIAASLTAQKRLWSLPVGAATAVRCAGDRRPPCFAIVEPSTGDALVHAIDPRTAAVGDEVARGPGIADVAVSADGRQLLICDGSPTVRVLDLDAHTEQSIKVDMSNTRSVAFDPGGGVLIAGTRAPVTYQVLRVRGADHTVLLQSDNEILFQPRAAPDGHATLVMGRLFMPHLYEIVAGP